ncbi:hypothetical protein J7643_09500 [bacterium]|nr:hypothetical protein [bacterium]
MKYTPYGLALILGLSGCALVSPAPRPGVTAEALPPLMGRLEAGVLNRFRSVQADLVNDVAKGATVSFIQPGATPLTVATTVTDAQGSFVLKLAGGFRPEAGSVYYLEAVKGLDSNLAGSSAARVRTLVRWNAGGWDSLTGGGVTLSLATTAVAAAAQINTRQGAAVALASLMGKLQSGVSDGVTPSTFTPVANLSVADYQAAYAVVSAALGGDLDPLASIDKIAGGGFYLKPVGGIGILPGLGADVADTVTLSGITFDADPSKNRVRFNGVSAAVSAVAADRRSIQVTVPDGATRGPVTVEVAAKTSAVSDYPILGTVRLSLSGIPGSTATASVTLTPSSGPAVTKTITSPGATGSLVFKGLVPGDGWALSATAVNAANQVWASTVRIDGPVDAMNLVAVPQPGPFTVGSGLNTWAAGLRLAPVSVTASASL